MFCDLIIHNDSEHSFQYVINLLAKTLRTDRATAYVIANEIQINKSAAIESAGLSDAQELCARAGQFGPDLTVKNSTGPLRITIDESLSRTANVVGYISNNGFLPSFEIRQKAAGADLHYLVRLPQMHTALFVNLICCVAFILTELSLGFMADIRAQDAIRGVGKSAAVVLYIWSGVLYSRACKANPVVFNTTQAALVVFIGEWFVFLIGLFW